MSWLCFATGCRFCSLSWQARSAGRNLITLFLTVNNPRQKFSRRHPSANVRKPAAERPSTPSTMPSRCPVEHASNAGTERKALKRSTFANKPKLVVGPGSDHDRSRRPSPTRYDTGPKRVQKLFTPSDDFFFRFGRNAQTFDRRTDACRGRSCVPTGVRTTAPLTYG